MRLKLHLSLGSLVLLCSLLEQGTAAAFTTCDRKYTKIGCFKEKHTHMDLIVNDRTSNSVNKLDWSKLAESIHSLACRCSEIARAAEYKFFAIRYWAECWAGKDEEQLQRVIKDPSKQSNECKNHEFKECNVDDKEECVGKGWAEYVYTIHPAQPATTTTSPPTTEPPTTTHAPKPVDCKWNAWGSYGACSKTCGVGTKTRTRTNTPAKFGGKACTGSSTNSNNCRLKQCPVDCKWNAWGSYGTCSKTCGEGIQTRTRSNTPAKFGGNACTGYSTSTQSCEVKKCTVDCKWNAWSSYGACSKTCGEGTQTRTRSNKPAKFGGNACTGSSTSSQPCEIKKCPVDCMWNAWGSYGVCSKTCGEGTQTRTRSNTPATFGGNTCTGSSTSSQSCEIKKCLVGTQDCTHVTTGYYCQPCTVAGNIGTKCRSANGRCGTCKLAACLHSPNYDTKYNKAC